MLKMLDKSIFAHLLFDRLEGRFGFNTFRWEAQGWLGTDENRMWLLSEGRYSNNQLDDGLQQLFYGRAITTYFDALVGVRYDLYSLPGRDGGAFGIQGLAPQFFQGLRHRLRQRRGPPRGEARGPLRAADHAATDPAAADQAQFLHQERFRAASRRRPVGLDAGLRLRHEITRQFTPYVGGPVRRHRQSCQCSRPSSDIYFIGFAIGAFDGIGIRPCTIFC